MISGSEMLRIQKNMQTALGDFWTELSDNDFIKTSITQSIRLRDLGINYSEITSSVNKLIEREEKIIDNNFDGDQFTDMIIHLRSYLFSIELEEIRYIFAKMLVPNKLKNRRELDDPILEDFTMNAILQRIGNKREWDGEKRRTHRKLFFIAFRNSIIHGNYLVEGQILSYENEDGYQENLDAKNFNKIKFEVDEIQTFIFTKYQELLTKV